MYFIIYLMLQIKKGKSFCIIIMYKVLKLSMSDMKNNLKNWTF